MHRAAHPDISTVRSGKRKGEREHRIVWHIELWREKYGRKYVERPQSHSPQKSRITKKADKLVSAAEYCRKFDTNEQTWRDETESPLLKQAFAERME